MARVVVARRRVTLDEILRQFVEDCEGAIDRERLIGYALVMWALAIRERTK